MDKDVAPAEGEPPNKKRKLLIIIIALAAVVLVASAVGAYLLLSKPAAEKKGKAAHGDEAGQAAAAKEEEGHPPVYEKLDTFTVNLADQQSFLQTEVQLLLSDTKVQEKLKAHMPEVRDAMIRLLSSKSAEELSQPEGKTKLAQEIEKQINEVLGAKKSNGVKKVLFAAFIIQ